MKYDSIRHKVDGRFINDTADTTSLPGYRVYPQPSDFEIALVPGHNVVIPPSLQPTVVTQETITEKIVNPVAKPGVDRGKPRLRWSGWAKGSFTFIQDLLRATAQAPKQFIPLFSNSKTSLGTSSAIAATGSCSSLAHSNNSGSSSSSEPEVSIEHDCDVADAVACSVDVADGANGNFRPRRGINESQVMRHSNTAMPHRACVYHQSA